MLNYLFDLHNICSVCFPIPILLILNEDEKAYISTIYVKYRGLLYKAATKYFPGNTHEVEDAVSSAVEKICRYSSSVMKIPEERIPSYLVKIVDNVCRTRLRQMKHGIVIESYSDETDPNESIEYGENPYETVFDYADTVSLINSFDALNERDKELIRMRHIDQMDYKEIAKEFGMNINTVRTAIFRAKQKLIKQAQKGGISV